MKLSRKARNIACDALASLFARGVDNNTGLSNGGYLNLYSGEQPQHADDDARGTLMGSLPFAFPAFAPAGLFTAGAASSVMVMGTGANQRQMLQGEVSPGVLSWFRLIGGDGTLVGDGQITQTGDGGDLQVDTLTVGSSSSSSSSAIAPGLGNVAVSLFLLTVPESGIEGQGTFRMSVASRNVVCSALAEQISSQAQSGVLKVYSGTQPTSPDSPATGVLLAAMTFDHPAYLGVGDVDAGQAVVNTLGGGSIIASGIASWFRVLDKDGDAFADGSIGPPGLRFYDLRMRACHLTVGGNLTVTALPLRVLDSGASFSLVIL